METWSGNSEKVEDAQAVFLERARLCSQASLGELDFENGICTKKSSR